VRVIAASNEDLYAKSRERAFRMDLYFRLSVVEVNLPPLRERVDDIPHIANHILKGIAERTSKPAFKLSPEAIDLLSRNAWLGNVRELENVLEMATIVCCGDTLEPAHLSYRIKDLRNSAPVNVSPDSMSMKYAFGNTQLDRIQAAIKECGGNIALVARKLQISRSTIYRRLKEEPHSDTSARP
jgi:DNA-binding NtrC family response regulator